MRSAALLILLALYGCAVGPDYQRPQNELPAVFLRAPAETAAPSFAEAAWWNIFGDPAMKALIQDALRDNLDLATAASQIVQARAQFGAARAPLFP